MRKSPVSTHKLNYKDVKLVGGVVSVCLGFFAFVTCIVCVLMLVLPLPAETSSSFWVLAGWILNVIITLLLIGCAYITLKLSSNSFQYKNAVVIIILAVINIISAIIDAVIFNYSMMYRTDALLFFSFYFFISTGSLFINGQYLLQNTSAVGVTVVKKQSLHGLLISVILIAVFCIFIVGTALAYGAEVAKQDYWIFVVAALSVAIVAVFFVSIFVLAACILYSLLKKFVLLVTSKQFPQMPSKRS